MFDDTAREHMPYLYVSRYQTQLAYFIEFPLLYAYETVWVELVKHQMTV